MTAVTAERVTSDLGSPVAGLVSVNVGLSRDVEWRGRTIHTGVWKSPVDGPQMLRTLQHGR